MQFGPGWNLNLRKGPERHLSLRAVLVGAMPDCDQRFTCSDKLHRPGTPFAGAHNKVFPCFRGYIFLSAKTTVAFCAIAIIFLRLRTVGRRGS
ncbi:hypothetical protein HNQ99_000214 [Rhizorhapis suberifaciens]|uniref:Uncharacterized protein n=1 Tax=Rhizorhapis suberifaciens TaxID=13656 RepID=A0A840HQV2_9SPHN|nr:hypothetical protein [Rhizorhapis suberifaciens]